MVTKLHSHHSQLLIGLQAEVWPPHGPAGELLPGKQGVFLQSLTTAVPDPLSPQRGCTAWGLANLVTLPAP